MALETFQDRPALDATRPFTRGDALAAGLSPKSLQTSKYTRLFQGVYVDSRVPLTSDVRTAAALAVHPPGAFASHTSAGRIFRLPLPPSPQEHVSVFDRNDRRPRRDLTSHVAPEGVRVISRRSLRVSCPLDTFLSLAAVLDLVDLVAAGDAMVRLGLADPHEIVAAADRSSQRGARPSRRAARFIRAGVDSAMETRVRLLLVLAGFPEPVVNHVLRGSDGGWVIRLDLSYPELKTVIEYDGRQHADDPVQWRKDIWRREQLDRLGWRVIILTAHDIYREPGEALLRILDVLAERGCPRLPRRLSNAWEPHFNHIR